MYRVFGVVLVLLALAIAIVPTYTDCQSQGKAITLANGNTTPMKCHWSGKAEIAAAVPIIAIGAMMTFTRRKNDYRNLSIMGIILGAAVIAIPTNALIGVCGNAMMTCASVMRPSLQAMGGVVSALSVVGLVMSSRMKE